jgi:hypothetical protein
MCTNYAIVKFHYNTLLLKDCDKISSVLNFHYIEHCSSSKVHVIHAVILCQVAVIIIMIFLVSILVVLAKL